MFNIIDYLDHDFKPCYFESLLNVHAIISEGEDVSPSSDPVSMVLGRK